MLGEGYVGVGMKGEGTVGGDMNRGNNAGVPMLVCGKKQLGYSGWLWRLPSKWSLLNVP